MAESKTVDFEYDGVTYTARRKPSLRVLRLLEQDKVFTAAEELLGTEAFESFLDSHDELEDFAALLDAYGSVAGLGN